MLKSNKLDVKCILNFYLAFGINEKGELKADRYNLRINSNSDDKNIVNFIQALETVSGFTCTSYEANREKQKHIDNRVRAILTLRDATIQTQPVTMPLRFSPVDKSESAINNVKKAFTNLIGLVEK